MDTRNDPFQILRTGDHVEVTGMPADEIREALTYWHAQQKSLQAVTKGITRSLTAIWAPPLVSEDRQRAAQKVAARRLALLDTPIFTYTTLAAVRGQKESSVRAWATAARVRDRLLKVDHEARIYLPAFQFNEDGDLRPEIGDVNRILNHADTMSDWSRWAWWHARTSYLAGASPIDVVKDDAEAVKNAAERQTARISA